MQSAADLRAWLAEHYSQHASVWLVTWKKHHPDKYLSRDDVLDELLCFGWIDGRRRKVDDDRTMQLISPRRHQAWAQSYKARAQRLMENGKMAAPGLASIETGKRSGLWDFYSDVDALHVPDDLAAALTLQPPASSTFDAFAPSKRRNILRWIKSAKTETTRAKRIATVASLAAVGQTPPHM